MSKDDLLRKGLEMPHIPWFTVNGRVLGQGNYNVWMDSLLTICLGAGEMAQW